jgi:hypothetical protein
LRLNGGLKDGNQANNTKGANNEYFGSAIRVYNECDRNLLTIKRIGVDGSGQDMQIEENYCMTRTGVEEMRLGLEAMLLAIREYLDD